MTDQTTILVVEDNDFVRMQIVRFLTGDGYIVKEATDGEAAISIIREEPIGISICDIRMEPMDGYTFVKHVRGLDNDMPFIFMTGDNNPDLLDQANKWGVSAVMIKPVQKERLLKTVERTLLSYRKKVGG